MTSQGHVFRPIVIEKEEFDSRSKQNHFMVKKMLNFLIIATDNFCFVISRLKMIKMHHFLTTPHIVINLKIHVILLMLPKGKY